MECGINDISGSIIDIDFATHEEMSEMAKLWDFEEIQIEKGPFTGSLHVIHTPHIQIAESIRSHGVIVKGKIPAGTYMFAYIIGNEEITHNSIPLTSKEILILDDEDEINFTSKSASLVISVVIEKDFFKRTCKALFDLVFSHESKITRIELKNPNGCNIKKDFDHWRQYLILNKDKWINDSVLTDTLERNIVKTLCSHLGCLRKHKLLSSEKNAIALRQYIEQYHDENITIKEICESLKISERSVRPSFKKMFGLNPKKYLSLYRLGRFRNSLIKHSSDHTLVSIAGYNDGLFHSSRLPGKYKDMFGELPSDILCKNKTGT